MEFPHQPTDEARRLETLRQYDLLDTLPEQALDDLTALAALICEAPISLLSLVDEKRQWFKSRVGLSAREMPREISFCGHALLQAELFIVPDAARDERFADNPLVTGDPNIRFYAGAPLITPEGQVLGTICVIDRQPRELTPAQKEALIILGRQVMAQLELRRQARELARSEASLTAQTETLTAVTESLAAYVERGDWKAAMGRLLRCALDQTQSEYGFIGVVIGTTLRVLAHEGIIWDKAINREFYEQALRSYAEVGYLEFTNFNNLFGRAITTGQVVIANMPDADPRSGGRPSGHPPMHSFLGVPILAAGQQVHGMVALANRPGGYSGEEQRRIETLVHHAGGLCTSYRNHEAGIELERERAKAQAAQRESEERLRLAIQAATIGLWDWNLETNEVIYSREWKAQLGFEEHEVKNEFSEWERLVHPEDLPAIVECIRRYVDRPEGAYEAEFRMRHKDGSWRWIYTRGEALRNGGSQRMLGCHVDITERKQTEAALRESEQRLRGVLETALDAIITIDAKGVVLEFNPAAEKMFGYRRDAALGRPMAELIIPLALRDAHYQGFQRYLSTGETRILGKRVEVPAVRSDGTEFEVELAIARVAQEGAPLFTAYLRDITERKRAELALRESEARFRELAETIEEVFWITSPDRNRMLYVSPAYEKIWGRTCTSLYESPHTWLEAVHPDDRERVLSATEARQMHGDHEETYRILRPDASVRWIHDKAFPIFGAGGRVLRIVGLAEDITGPRQLEEQFRQSQKMEAFGQLAGGVAHDFNNILAVIMMQVELTGLSKNLPEEVQDDLRHILASAERAADLTRQLLLFSRKQVMQPRKLDLNESVTSLDKMLQRIIGEDVHLQLNLHPRPLFIRADAGMLDQVLMNLVINARDAMPGGGQIVIETSEKTLTAAEAAAIPDAAPGSHVCLRVTDTGGGMLPEILAHIFEPFFTTKEPGKGTGLGLATVFGIVKQHHAALTVESEVGQGTTFRIFLRAQEVTAQARAEEPIKTQPRGGTETILLAEDEPSVRMLTRMVLEQAGYRVLEAAHGVEALQIWEREAQTIQLLLTDLVMPEGLSGRALAARLQTNKPGLRVIFTSGYSAEIAGRELALQEGQNFLQKPASARHILETVRRCLDG